MLNWDDLRFFVELARSGSLSKAARHLDADHSTVARRIAALEEALALKLFDRLPRGYALTEDGEQLLDRANLVEQAVHGVQRFASGAAPGIAGRVRISAPPALASHWLVPRLVPLLARHPGLKVDVSGTPAAARLSRNEADLALRLSRPQEKGLVARRLGDLAYGLYGARAYVEATPEPRRVYLGYDEELARSPQQIWLETVAQGRPIVFQSNDLSSLISAVRTGIGLAALPHVLARQDDLTCVMEGEVTRELWLVVHPDLKRAARVRAVMNHIIEVCRELKDH
ncbi:LysR family transcriptional regulator [Xanthobacter sp. YC-JY1]|uniref:LysR family transcriptional regulator n=1 Tax=Xanthobacter sp. YC-JY1 TaxID=2419844 RepID=UPI001F475525|nr:LysR family transcriptional regulator [Xanthobacter sp. YC-JY1]UJX44477.1 LysR family transcriptional regulator [Xanthobacter sp. YC-JY1]